MISRIVGSKLSTNMNLIRVCNHEYLVVIFQEFLLNDVVWFCGHTTIRTYWQCVTDYMIVPLAFSILNSALEAGVFL
jgi:hypothetical protein